MRCGYYHYHGHNEISGLGLPTAAYYECLRVIHEENTQDKGETWALFNVGPPSFM